MNKRYRGRSRRGQPVCSAKTPRCLLMATKSHVARMEVGTGHQVAIAFTLFIQQQSSVYLSKVFLFRIFVTNPAIFRGHF